MCVFKLGIIGNMGKLHDLQLETEGINGAILY